MAAAEVRRRKAVDQTGAGAQHEKTTAKQRPVSMSLEHVKGRELHSAQLYTSGAFEALSNSTSVHPRPD